MKMDGRGVYRTVSPKRTPFQTGTDRWPHLRKVLRRRWISHKYPMWLWGHSLFKISSPEPVFYGTKWLLGRPHKQSPTFLSKCRIDKGVIKRGSTIGHWRSQCNGRIIVAHSLSIHSFDHSYIWNSVSTTSVSSSGCALFVEWPLSTFVLECTRNYNYPLYYKRKW
jgi:hypothetical protein